MRIPLASQGQRTALLAGSLLLAVLYAGLALAEVLAAHFAETPSLGSLKRAVWLQPGNADYRYRLGRYFSLVETSPEEAAQAFHTATMIDPHQARYWFALAGAYQLLGNDSGQRQAVERATAVEPTTPEVAWEAANFYIVQGNIEAALRNLRVVLTFDPYLPESALPLCWRIRPDIDFLLREVVPPITSVNSGFLEFLISKSETDAAGKVWARLVQLNQPVSRRYAFGYVLYLVGKQQPEKARLAWLQAANLSDLVAYQPSSQNLIVNGDFSLEILNAGFDWLHQETPGVSLALDPTQFYAGHSSLNLTFDSRGFEDAGIRQLIAVEPNTAYKFSGYFKAEDMQGAGGLRFVIQDLYTSKTYFTGEDFANVEFWKQVTGTFNTDSDTRLVMLRLQREPAGSPIKGRLWIDDLRLAPVRSQEGGN